MSVSGHTVEGRDEPAGDFRRSPQGRASFGPPVRRRALTMRPASTSARLLPAIPNLAASCALARAIRATRP